MLGPYLLRAHTRPTIGDALVLPLAVNPETTIKGHLAFDAAMDLAFEYDEETHGTTVKRGFEVSLRVTDHVTGEAVEHLIESNAIPVEESDDLSPSSTPE